MSPMLDAMSTVRDTLLQIMEDEPGLRDCHLACGTSPARPPPDEQLIDVARRAVCEALGVSDPEHTAALHHSASPLRYGLFWALTRATQDIDVHPAKWLRKGAPLGIENPIPEGATSRRRMTLLRLPWIGWRVPQRSAATTPASGTPTMRAPSRR